MNPAIPAMTHEASPSPAGNAPGKPRVTPPRTTAHLEWQLQYIRGEVEGPPIAKLIGLTPTYAEVGLSIIEMLAESRHANPMGTLHGGVICDIADLAMGTAMSTTLEDDESFTTLDLTTKFFKPVWNSRLKAIAMVTRRSRSLGFVECEVLDESGSLVAKVFSSCMVLRGDQAKGR
jgi:uncharacterized protein (TIGR00369 family)